MTRVNKAQNQILVILMRISNILNLNRTKITKMMTLLFNKKMFASNLKMKKKLETKSTKISKMKSRKK